jgi:threonine dehydrogenase-like Zn-dependent dehydrogenase
VSRRSFALDIARRMGAEETLSFEDPDEIVAQVTALTGGKLCERVIEATGKQAGLDLAAKLTGERGRLVIAGYHQDGPRQVDMQLWNWRGLDVVNAHERSPAIYARGVREAAGAVASGLIDLDALLTHAFPLDRLDEALAATRDRPDGFLKGYVTCR